MVRALAVWFQIALQLQVLPVEIVFEKNVAVQLRCGMTISVDVLRTAGVEKVPFIFSSLSERSDNL